MVALVRHLLVSLNLICCVFNKELGLPTFNFAIPGHLNYRVTISGKAKIGTMDGHFSRDRIYGLIIFFY